MIRRDKLEVEYQWFIDAVRNARIELGLSQDQLADLTGIPRSMIGSIETFKTRVTWVRILCLAHFLEIDLNQFVEQFSESSKGKSIIESSRKFMIAHIEEQKNSLKASIEALARFESDHGYKETSYQESSAKA